MSKLYVKLDGREVSNLLLKSDDITELLKEKAEEIVSRCSGSYEISEKKSNKKSVVSIITRDPDTFHHNLKNNELLKALKEAKT